MFIGHWAPAFAAAAIGPKAPKLGTLFIAGQLVDWAFFTFAMTGVEAMRIDEETSVMSPLDLYHMPYTHSLAGSLGWAVLFALILFAMRRDWIGATIGACVVLSHWLLDLLVHVPDLTIAGGDTKLGFGLWDHPAIVIPLELGLTFGAFAFYLARTRGSKIPAAILAIVLVLVQSINWFGPPPAEANTEFFLTAVLAFGIVTALAYWVGKTRHLNASAH